MPNILDLRGKRISQTYKRVVQIDNSKFYDGEGNLIIDLATLQNPQPQNGVFVYNEVPNGIQNATNLIFTTANLFVAGSTKLYKNGLRLKPGSGNDYTESNSFNQVAFINPPFPTDNILIEYELVNTIVNKSNQLLTGVQNAINLIFTTPQTFTLNSTKLYRNGLRLRHGLTFDYIESSTNQITFNQPPYQTDNILIDYEI